MSIIKTTSYKDAWIYKIRCNDPAIKECYIGATTGFNNRKSKHKRVCETENQSGYNFKVYKFIRENGGWNNWTMEKIEKCECTNKLDFRKKERQAVDFFNSSLNTYRPYITHDEKKAVNLAYYHKNSETINKKRGDYFKAYNKKRRDNNYHKEYAARPEVKARKKIWYENNKLKKLNEIIPQSSE